MGGRQEPFVYGSLSSRGVYLAAAPAAPEPGGAGAAVTTPSAVDSPDSHRIAAERLAVEREFWASVKDSADPLDVQAYLDRYPTGQYAVLARNRLKRMEGKAESITGRPEPPVPVAGAGAQPVASVAPAAAPVAGVGPSPASGPTSQPSPAEMEFLLALSFKQQVRIQHGLASLGEEVGIKRIK